MQPQSEADSSSSAKAPLSEITVGEFMTPHVITVHPDDVMDVVLERMVSSQRACVVVVGVDDVPVGLITDRDLSWYLSWVRSGAAWSAQAVEAVRARTLMTSKIVIAKRDETVEAVLARTRAAESREIPIVDHVGRLIGLITQMDLFCACSRVAAERRTTRAMVRSTELRPSSSAVEAVLRPVVSLVRKDVVHLTPEDPIQDAIDLMAEGRISCILIAIEMRPVGILTERDVTLLSSVVDKPFARARRLSEVMQTSLLTIHESETIYDALCTISNEPIRHLPVVNDAGRLVGIVTQTDLLLASREAFRRDLVPGEDGAAARNPEAT